MQKKNILNSATQVLIPSLTIGAQIAIAMKYPQYGLIINLSVQPFWLYSGWRAWHEAEQSGIFVTSIICTIIIIMGVVNYWFL